MNEIFKKDFSRVTKTEYSLLKFIKNMINSHTIRFLYVYRLNKKSILRKILRKRFMERYGLEIGPDNIGEGLYLGHTYNISINGDATIGKNCNIHKGVTIGAENRGNRKGCPIIGDRVWIGVNSTIVGNIRIGDNVLIAPNSYINRDIPSNSVVFTNGDIKIKHNEKATEGYINNINK